MKNITKIALASIFIFCLGGNSFALEKEITFHLLIPDSNSASFAEIESKTEAYCQGCENPNSIGSESESFNSNNFSEGKQAKSVYTRYGNTAWVAEGCKKEVKMTVSNKSIAQIETKNFKGENKAEVRVNSYAVETRNGVLVLSSQTETNANIWGNSYNDEYASIVELGSDSFAKSKLLVDAKHFDVSDTTKNSFKGETKAETKMGSVVSRAVIQSTSQMAGTRLTTHSSQRAIIRSSVIQNGNGATYKSNVNVQIKH